MWEARQTYSDSELSRHGLPAHAAHPLFRTVSLDRTFYRALDAAAYARLARQVPDDFRFVVKAPAEITDATLRMPDSGRPMAPNPHFLDPQRAIDLAVLPAVAGLGHKLGALVFQLPPLPLSMLSHTSLLLGKLDALWAAVMPAVPDGTVVALELRDARALTPALLQQLARHRVRWCIGAHDRMPPAAAQASLMRGAGAGDLVCRWTEGSAPLSVIELAKAILHQSDNAPLD